MTTEIIRSEIDALQEQLALVERRCQQLSSLLSSMSDDLDETLKKEQAQLIVSDEAARSAQEALSNAKEAHSLALTALAIAKQTQTLNTKKEEKTEVTVAAQSPDEPETPEIPETPETPETPEATEETEEVEEVEEVEAVEEVEEAEVEETSEAPSVAESGSEPQVNTTGAFLPPVDHIRNAISLGDKFLFHRELFGGDGEKMQRTIDTLDSMTTMDEAMAYINKHCKWDKESQAYQLFMGVLQRRFSN